MVGNMKPKLVFLLSSIAMVMITAAAFAAEIKEIELSDGSVITGEVISLGNGVYTIRTEAMGTLAIEESKVRSIRQRGSASPSASSSSSGSSSGQSADITRLQQQIMSDDQVLDMLQSLQNDPEFMKIMEDPEIMKAVNSGDTAALMANPKFLRLMQNPSVKHIQQKLSK